MERQFPTRPRGRRARADLAVNKALKSACIRERQHARELATSISRLPAFVVAGLLKRAVRRIGQALRFTFRAGVRSWIVAALAARRASWSLPLPQQLARAKNKENRRGLPFVSACHHGEVHPSMSGRRRSSVRTWREQPAYPLNCRAIDATADVQRSSVSTWIPPVRVQVGRVRCIRLRGGFSRRGARRERPTRALSRSPPLAGARSVRRKGGWQ
jgi:hypothetical protein